MAAERFTACSDFSCVIILRIQDREIKLCSCRRASAASVEYAGYVGSTGAARGNEQMMERYTRTAVKTKGLHECCRCFIS